ncbi:hypothetical protein ACJ8L7_09025 [Bifidobacterium pseudocatenulatum]|uniref:hypothetical protein n=1 Tax=Bifidobacterium pseudocatenulatum TaxID=28026 RepID=UPI003B9C91DF
MADETVELLHRLRITQELVEDCKRQLNEAEPKKNGGIYRDASGNLWIHNATDLWEKIYFSKERWCCKIDHFNWDEVVSLAQTEQILPLTYIAPFKENEGEY